jgi:hypothetical protein
LSQIDAMNIANDGNACRKDTAWVSTAIKSWTDRSSWRMVQ